MEDKCTIAIWGRPKSGKSTLFKLLTRGSDEINNEGGVPCCNTKNSKVYCMDLPYWDFSKSDQSFEYAKSFENVDVVYYVISTSCELLDSDETRQAGGDMRCEIFDDINHIQNELSLKVLVILNCSYKKILYGNWKEKIWEDELDKKGIGYIKCDLFIDFSIKLKSLEDKTKELISSDKRGILCLENKGDNDRRNKIASNINATLKELANDVLSLKSNKKEFGEVEKNINEHIRKFYENLEEGLSSHNMRISEKKGPVISGFQSIIASCAISSFLGAGFLPILAAGTLTLIQKLGNESHNDENIDISQCLGDKKILRIYVNFVVYIWYFEFYDRWYKYDDNNLFAIEYMSGVIIPKLIESIPKKENYDITTELLVILGI